MEFRVLQITSAATPDFHANPIPFITAALKNGRIPGRMISARILLPGMPKTFAISISPLSASEKPVLNRRPYHREHCEKGNHRRNPFPLDP